MGEVAVDGPCHALNAVLLIAVILGCTRGALSSVSHVVGLQDTSDMKQNEAL